ncbi:MAG TPA: hypothetical protein VMZ91_03635 [Candidatus Paceibacterota bacterium]|nr:hypothetical protein [Candidatus Paceibacterota bacterium]
MKNYLSVKDMADFDILQKHEKGDRNLSIFLVSRFYGISPDKVQELDIKTFQTLWENVEKYITSGENVPKIEEAVKNIKIIDKDMPTRFELMDL